MAVQLACDVERLLQTFGTVVGSFEPEDYPDDLLGPDKVQSLRTVLIEVLNVLGMQPNAPPISKRATAAVGSGERAWVSLSARLLAQQRERRRQEALSAAMQRRQGERVALMERLGQLERQHAVLESESADLRCELFVLRAARPAHENRQPALSDRLSGKMLELRPVNLNILERQVLLLAQSANHEEAARAEERLGQARQHNRRVARVAAASIKVEAHARGRLTRARLRREREVAQMAELQRETEAAWAKTLSRPAPKGRRGTRTRRQHALETAAAAAYFGERGLPPPDSQLAAHARALASAINQRRVCVEERMEGIRRGTVVVVDPRAVREEQLREEGREVKLRPPSEMFAAIQARREQADERMTAIAEGKLEAIDPRALREAKSRASRGKRLAALNAARQNSRNKHHTVAETREPRVSAGGLPEGGTAGGCASNEAVLEEEEESDEEEWQRVLDHTYNKEYFWNNVTDEVRWTEPPELVARRATASQ